MENSLKYPKSRWLIMWTVFFGWLGLGVMVVAYSPIVGEVAEHFNVPVGTISLYTMGLYTIATAVASIISGILFDVIGVKKVMFIGSLLIFIAAVLTPLFIESLTGLVIQRLLLGIGGGPIMACVAKLGAEWFPVKERGTYNGVTAAGFAAGMILSLLISGRITTATGSWQTAVTWLIIGPVIGMIFMILMMIFCKESQLPKVEGVHTNVNADGNAQHIFRRVLKTPVFYLLVLMGLCYTWSLNAFNDLTPGYIAIAPPMGIGLGAVFAGTVMTIVQVGNVIGSLCSGILVDKIFKGNGKPVIVVAFLVNCICALSVKFSFVYSNTGLLCVMLFLVGFSIACIMPCVSTFIACNLPLSVCGKVYSFCLGFGLVVGSLGVSIGSMVLLATGSYHGPIMLVSGIAFIGFLGAIFIYKPKLYGDKEAAIKDTQSIAG